MSIKAGDSIPSVTISFIGNNGPEKKDINEVLAGKKTVLFGVPGAFTPTCDANHLPGFIDQIDAFTAKGVDQVLCVSVNDAFVMKAWAERSGAVGKVHMIADGNADLTNALGLGFDASGFGMATRLQRCALLVNDNTVEYIDVEAAGAFEVSKAEYVLGKI